MTNKLLAPEVVAELRGAMRRPLRPLSPDRGVIDKFFEYLESEKISVTAVEQLAGVKSKMVHAWRVRTSRPNVVSVEQVLDRLGLKLTLEKIVEVPINPSSAKILRPGRPRSHVRTSSPLMREVLKVVDDLGEKGVSLTHMAEIAGVSHHAIHEWRSGVTSARLASVERLMASWGYQIVMVRKDGVP